MGAGRQEDAEALVRPALRSLLGAIPGVLGVAEGDSSSPERMENGYDFGFVVTFDSAGARYAYLDHPVHRPVG